MTELARGFYKISGSANLRWRCRSDGAYPVLATLSAGDLVYSVGGHPQRDASYFDGSGPRTPGWRTDHTWVVALSTMEDDGAASQGWIDNGRMTPVRDEVTPAFNGGDVLYGRREAREPWLNRLSETPANFGSQIAGIRYNIIDDLNNAVISGMATDDAVQKFADFLENSTDGKASAVRIRQMCKSGLTYITATCGRDVHFVLGGLDAGRVLAEAGVEGQQGLADEGLGMTKHCTGAEMRRLMRQRMFDEGGRSGCDYGIQLQRVHFYLAMARVPAPWERGAPDMWANAWRGYCRHRQAKRLRTI